jgi:hypothetical protein
MSSASESAQRTFLVEHYRPAITIEEFRETASRMRRVADEMASSEPSIRFLHSTLVPEDETAFCVFRASSRTVVEEAYRRAGVSFERIVDALELEQPVAD